MGKHLSFAFIVRASPLAYCTSSERGRSNYNKKLPGNADPEALPPLISQLTGERTVGGA